MKTLQIRASAPQPALQPVAAERYILLQTDETPSFQYRRAADGAWSWLGADGLGEWQLAPAGRATELEALYATFVAEIAPIAPLDWLGVWRP